MIGRLAEIKEEYTKLSAKLDKALSRDEWHVYDWPKRVKELQHQWSTLFARFLKQVKKREATIEAVE